jgi:hypothetical protein
MWPLLLLASLSALAQMEEIDLSSIRALEQKLPDYQPGAVESSMNARTENKYRSPFKIEKLEKIEQSGVERGSITGGVPIVRIEDNRVFSLARSITVGYYEQEDEHGFKYLINHDGGTTFKIDTRYVEPLKQDLAMYEPPTRFSPAPFNKVKVDYDESLSLLPETRFSVGAAQGYFIQDVFNDSNAKTGVSTQYGMHLFTNWKHPMKIGGALNYERTDYSLSSGGKVNFTSLSFGPQIKSKDIEVIGLPLRWQIQFRYGPFATATSGSTKFNFTATDIMGSVEHPMKNSWGEFVIGAYYQIQWLNFKNQPEIVSVRASNKANTAFGLTISQVFN